MDNKVIELAREVWGFENWTHVQLEMIERFYTLARADLEADLVKHRELLAHHLSVIDPLRAENASLGKRHAALLESHAHLEAENAELREANEAFGKRQEWWTERMCALEVENAKLKHNVHVLTDALWKSCGDDEETVNATIESQGVLK